MSEIPIVPWAKITPAWMTNVLGKAGFDARVAQIQGKRVGTGQVGESVRFTLIYDGPAKGAPATVVGKFPSSDPVSRATGVDLGNYFREVWFYRNLAAGAGVTTPKCLHADVDPESHDFVLIMEDLAPAQPGDQMRGVTVEAAALVLEEAAKLHASHWGDDALDDMPWVQESRAAKPFSTGEMMRALWAGFRDRYGARIRPDCVEIGEAITANFEGFKTGYDGPRCLVHNDFRPDNMMFRTADGGYPVAVVDWQSYGYGGCMADVSYFMAGALGRDERRAHEDRLLRGYHARLIALGVGDYDFDALWRDYARFSPALFIMAFAASMIVERTERGDAMFFAMLETGASLVTDLDGLNVLAAERSVRGPGRLASSTQG